ncbi:MAG: hypothetical protein AAFS07_18915 [Pseudomonadota bacterium]
MGRSGTGEQLAVSVRHPSFVLTMDGTVENRLRDRVSGDHGAALALCSDDLAALNAARQRIGTDLGVRRSCRNGFPIVLTLRRSSVLQGADGVAVEWNDVRPGDPVRVCASLAGIRIHDRNNTYDEEWTLHRLIKQDPPPPERQWAPDDDGAPDPVTPTPSPDPAPPAPPGLQVPVLRRSRHYDEEAPPVATPPDHVSIGVAPVPRPPPPPRRRPDDLTVVSGISGLRAAPELRELLRDPALGVLDP